jgi:hypothetical protein
MNLATHCPRWVLTWGWLWTVCTFTLGGCAQSSSGGSGGVAPISAALSTVQVLPNRSIVANGVDEATIEVTVLDGNGQPRAELEVRLEVTGSDNTLTQAGTSDAQGRTSGNLVSSKAELKRISATIVTEDGEVRLTVEPIVEFIGDRNSISTSLSTVTVDPAQDVLANGTEVSNITVQIVDALGNALQGETVEIQVTGSANNLTHDGSSNDLGTILGTLTSTLAEIKQLTVIVDPAGLQVQLDPQPQVVFIADANNISTSLSTVVADPESALRDGVDTSTITVTIRDGFGNPVPDQEILLEATGSGNLLVQPPGPTDALGQAAGTLASTESGEKTISAKVGPSGNTRELDEHPTVLFVFFPQVAGLARYLDLPPYGSSENSDQLIIPFDHDLVVNSAMGNDLGLPVAGDALGVNAMLSIGNDAAELIVDLGLVPRLKARQSFDAALTLSNSPSGIDVSSTMTADAIEGVSGLDARASAPIDVVPGFVGVTQVISGQDTFAVAFGDLDCDGFQDAVAANNLSTPDRVLLNDRTGNLVDSQQTLGNSSSRFAALADIDADGDLDLAVATLSTLSFPPIGTANTIWANDGRGKFTHLQDFGDRATEVLQFGDVDRDGDFDLVTGNTAGQANRVYLNSDGVFTDSNQRWGSDSTEFLVLADVDGDRYLDLIEANGATQLATNKVRLNDGSGSFNLLSQAIDTQDLTLSVAAGDLDRDGWVDLLFGGQGVQVWTNNGGGAGTFSASGVVLADTSRAEHVQLIDLDQDGWLDLFVGVAQGADLLFWNDGSGGLRGPSEKLSAGDTHGASFGDVDNDGDSDLYVASGTGHPNRLFLNSLSAVWGNASLAPGAVALPDLLYGLVAADLNEDGHVDVAGGFGPFANETLEIFLGDGSGNLATTQQNLVSQYLRDLDVADFDLDGDLDLVTANAPNFLDQPFSNKVWFNDGQAQFSESQQSLGDFDETEAVRTGDLNLDGYPDVVFADSSAVRIWLNDARGPGVAATFTEQPALPGGYRSIDLGDLDHDCDLDLVAGHYTTGTGLTVWRNAGNGQFSQAYSDALTVAQSILIAELDGDGAPDLLVSGTFPGPTATSRVLVNNGSGTAFSTRFDFSRANLTFTDAADFDADGDLDILLDEAGATSLWRNNGQAQFLFSTALNFASGRFADLNADADFDVVGSSSTAVNQ